MPGDPSDFGPVDKKAIQAWVEEQTDEDENKLKVWYDSLKNLENGEAWVWHPEKPVIYQKVKFRKRETFHATREFIRSPQASQIKLMNVSEFVSKFRAVFEAKTIPAAAPATLPVNPAIDKYAEQNKQLQKDVKVLQVKLKNSVLVTDLLRVCSSG